MKETTFSDYKERILRVLVHVQQNLDEELSLDELARIACFSPYHFHRRKYSLGHRKRCDNDYLRDPLAQR